MDNREQIAELAKAYVCPLNLNPSTPYEIGMVRQYTTFALMVIEEFGYTRPAEPAMDMVEEDVIEPIINFYVPDNCKEFVIDVWQQFRKRIAHDQKQIKGEL